MKSTLLLVLGFLISLSMQGQKIAVGYHFDGCGFKAQIPSAEDLKNRLPASCDCGIDSDAVILDGQTLEMPASLDSFFRNDYSLCFSVLMDPFSGEMDLVSKVARCNSDTALRISYRTRDSSFLVNIKRGLDRNIFLNGRLDASSCWQTVCLSKIGIDFRLFVNGVLQSRVVAPNVINLDNKVPLLVNGSPCQNNGLLPGMGKIDRLIIANYGFDAAAVDSLYQAQQKILTQDTIIFLGDQFKLRTASNCPGSTNWTPGSGLSASNIPDPVASPLVDTRYIAHFSITGCTNTDTVLVRVVDKSKLECQDLRLPSAFTPNQDGLNEVFGISNYYIIEKLDYFTILDRNGGILFETNDPEKTWDGQFKGSALAPGTYYYRVSYQCKSESFQTRGSFMLLR